MSVRFLGPAHRRSQGCTGTDLALDLEHSNFRIMAWLPNFCTGTMDAKDGNNHEKQYIWRQRCSGDVGRSEIYITHATRETYGKLHRAAGRRVLYLLPMPRLLALAQRMQGKRPESYHVLRTLPGTPKSWSEEPVSKLKGARR